MIPPTKNRYALNQYYKVRDLPRAILDCQKSDPTLKYRFSNYSENLIVYPGASDIHVFDIDRERWLISNTQLPAYDTQNLTNQ